MKRNIDVYNDNQNQFDLISIHDINIHIYNENSNARNIGNEEVFSYKDDNTIDEDHSGLIIWPGSRIMALFLCHLFNQKQKNENVNDFMVFENDEMDTFVQVLLEENMQDVLEVGCGQGLSGLMMAKLLILNEKDQKVIFCDRNNLCLNGMRFNINKNNLNDKCESFHFDWNDHEMPLELMNRFQLIIGADIIYPNQLGSSIEHLFEKISQLLSHNQIGYFLFHLKARVDILLFRILKSAIEYSFQVHVLVKILSKTNKRFHYVILFTKQFDHNYENELITIDYDKIDLHSVENIRTLLTNIIHSQFDEISCIEIERNLSRLHLIVHDDDSSDSSDSEIWNEDEKNEFQDI